MVLQRGDEIFTVDARPSDSIAIALRTRAELFAGDELLTASAFEITSADDEGDALSLGGEETGAAEGPSSGLSPEQLKEHLRKLNPEDLGRFNP